MTSASETAGTTGTTARRPLYLHVGCRKTATTTLQRGLFTKTDAVRSQGIGIPIPDRTEHVGAMLSLRRVDPDGTMSTFARNSLRLVTEALATTEGDRLVMSHEVLSWLEPHQIKPLTDVIADADLDLHVVITARDVGRQLPSEWQQITKERSDVSYADYAAAVATDGTPESAQFHRRQDVADVAERWGASLAPDHVHVVTVPPSGSSFDILPARFCSVIQVEPSTLDGSESRNISLGAPQAETLRRVNAALGDWRYDQQSAYRETFRNHVMRKYLMTQEGPSLRLPAELHGWAVETGERIAAGLVDGGYDVVGDVRDLVPAPKPGTDTPHVDDADVADVATKVLADLLTEEHRRNLRRAKAARTTAAGAPAGD